MSQHQIECIDGTTCDVPDVLVRQSSVLVRQSSVLGKSASSSPIRVNTMPDIIDKVVQYATMIQSGDCESATKEIVNDSSSVWMVSHLLRELECDDMLFRLVSTTSSEIFSPPASPQQSVQEHHRFGVQIVV